MERYRAYQALREFRSRLVAQVPDRGRTLRSSWSTQSYALIAQ
jgi:hypothetical protein